MHCLDSDFLIEYMKGMKAAGDLLRDVAEDGAPSVSAVSAFEVTHTRSAAVRDAAVAFVSSFDVFPVDGSTAFAASRLAVDLRARGRELPMADLLIAATCLLHDLTLVTRNRKHFSQVPRLRVRSW